MIPVIAISADTEIFELQKIVSLETWSGERDLWF